MCQSNGYFMQTQDAVASKWGVFAVIGRQKIFYSVTLDIFVETRPLLLSGKKPRHQPAAPHYRHSANVDEAEKLDVEKGSPAQSGKVEYPACAMEHREASSQWNPACENHSNAVEKMELRESGGNARHVPMGAAKQRAFSPWRITDVGPNQMGAPITAWYSRKLIPAAASYYALVIRASPDFPINPRSKEMARHL
ncbi:hypothetical protein L209DRAFT_763233 [Thermothelomyces heterothallicus CBS 203.75]